ncbi:MAG: 3'-5' exonuclease [Shewanella sp.]
MWQQWRRYWYGRKFRESEFAPLFAQPIKGELVALDFETTSLNPKQAEIVSVGAVHIVGNRLLTGQALSIKVLPPISLNAQSVVVHGLRHVDLVQGLPLEAALRQLLTFIGPRPLVGYHIGYDLQILNLACQRLWGLTLAHRAIEVSQLYHDHLYQRYPDAVIDLHLASICQHLGIPKLPLHDALGDATTAALIYLSLTQGSALGYPKV